MSGLRRIDISRKTGCNLETIRYYEKIGLLPDPPRSSKNHRVYDYNHVIRLAFIVRARELGFSLDEIRGLLRLVDGGNSTCAEVSIVAKEHLHDVRRKIADLRKIEVSLADTISQCSEKDIPQCAVIDALSAGRTI